jgi:hypothetical protein
MLNLKVLSAFCCLLLLSFQSFAQEPLRKTLLKNVGPIPLTDTTNAISLFYTANESAEIIAIVDIIPELKLKGTMIMASKYGKGQILALGSNTYFEKHLLENKSVRQLILNARDLNPKGNVAIYGTSANDLISFFKAEKINAKVLPKFDIENKIKTLFITDDLKDSVQLEKLTSFVKNGGTLIFGSPYGAIFKVNDKTKPKNLTLKINDLFTKAGIFNVNVLIFPTKKYNHAYTDSIPAYLHINTLLPYTLNPSTGDEGYYKSALYVKPTLDLVLESNDVKSPLIERIKHFYKIPADTVYQPSKAHPLDISTSEKKTAYRMAEKILAKQEDHKLGYKRKAAGYELFPGKVPDEAERITKNVIIPVKVGTQGLYDMPSPYYRPHTTGLYIPAGEKVKVIIDKKYLSQKLKAQVGVHNDDLIDNLDQLTRIGTDLTKTFELIKDTTDVFSPYGGLLLINISDTSSLKSIDIKVDGAVNAPYFKLGETNTEDWNKAIKNYPAPWAELATDNVILTLPSYRVRNMDNPGALLTFYDRVMNADADLRVIDRKRVHTERIILDQQVMAGSLFTMPYKIVGPDDDENCNVMLNVDSLEIRGSWGIFHELGHRHQFNDIDFDGLGEVTVNLYSMYVYDQVLKLGKYQHKDHLPSKEGVIQHIKNYMRMSPSYDKFKQDPWIALSMYIEIIEQFGWDAIKTSNKAYADLPKSDYPKSNEQAIDLWFNTICKATKSDLGMFFDIWKLPVSAEAKQKAKQYPVWLPEELEEFKAKTK